MALPYDLRVSTSVISQINFHAFADKQLIKFASNLVGELITELPRPDGLRVIPAEFPQFLDLTCFKQLPCIWTQTAEQIDFKFDRSIHYSALQAWSTFGNVLMNCSSDFSPLWFTPQWGHASTYALFLMPQVPFARYVARNNIQHIKRYNIERVFRQKKMLGLHPRELTECAFDIITAVPTRSVWVWCRIKIIITMMHYGISNNW